MDAVMFFVGVVRNFCGDGWIIFDLLIGVVCCCDDDDDSVWWIVCVL